jgi:hypothetical protein
MELRSSWRSHVWSLSLGVALLGGAAGPAAAQKSVVGMIVKDVEHAGRDIGAVWLAPFDASARDLLAGIFVLGLGAAVSPFDDEIDRWVVNNQNSSAFDVLEPVRKGGFLYSGGALAPVAAGVYIVGIVTKRQGLRDALMGCGGTWLSNNMLRHQVLYRFIGRERPDPTRGDDPNWPAAEPGDQYNFKANGWDGAPWGMHSFPGGHIANIAGCASFFTNRFEWGFVEPILYAFTGAVWVARLVDRAHWNSDQVVGTAFGWAIGKEIAHRQLRREAARNNPATANGSSSALVAPRDGFYVTRTAEGARVGWHMTF